MRFTIQEYANAYSISTEMVKSRIRRNRLNYIIEDNETYIVVPKHQVPFIEDEKESAKQVAQVTPEKKTTVATVIGLYQKENHYLKVKIENLEEKIDRLISEKEQLLKDERQRIEKVYQDKDVQLKTILELINTKLLQENTQTQISTHEVEASEPAIEAHIENNVKKAPVELKKYLRSLGLKSVQRKKIKRSFAEAFGSDSRIILKNGLFYLDFDRYDYSDLIKTK